MLRGFTIVKGRPALPGRSCLHNSGAHILQRRATATAIITCQRLKAEEWPPLALEWLRRLGGKLGWAIDRDGVYILLCGLAAIWQAVAALTHLERHPSPTISSPAKDVGNHQLPTS